MKILLAIGTGSFIGGVLRYLLSQLIQTKVYSTFPFGTLTVNILGCFVIGLVFGLSDKAILPQEWRLFLATGVLGGFTTFSAFSNETVYMLRDGQFWYASAYVGISVFIGIVATFIGISLIKLI
ncbi:MAG: fluoride efflux transporter CrcB [Bacteroidetes bacterium]|nr:fluoride efflux transporter CrcB [Bacteroidota bacterium]